MLFCNNCKSNCKLGHLIPQNFAYTLISTMNPLGSRSAPDVFTWLHPCTTYRVQEESESQKYHDAIFKDRAPEVGQVISVQNLWEGPEAAPESCMQLHLIRYWPVWWKNWVQQSWRSILNGKDSFLKQLALIIMFFSYVLLYHYTVICGHDINWSTQ